MATAATQKKKQEGETDLRLTINQWLDMISESRKGIGAADIGKFEAIGRKSLEEKEKKQSAAPAAKATAAEEKRQAAKMSLSTKPGRALDRIVVERKPGQESYVDRMVNLAEQFELAAQEQRKPKDVNFKKFVQKG